MEIGHRSNVVPVKDSTDPGINSSSARSPEQVAQERKLIQAVKALNGTDLFGHDSELTFVFDRNTGRALARIVSKTTGEVVMQIPPEYVIRMAQERQRG